MIRVRAGEYYDHRCTGAECRESHPNIAILRAWADRPGWTILTQEVISPASDGRWSIESTHRTLRDARIAVGR
jgi:hypothetical protein